MTADLEARLRRLASDVVYVDASKPCVPMQESIVIALHAAVEIEREACATIVTQTATDTQTSIRARQQIADAIRARGCQMSHPSHLCPCALCEPRRESFAIGAAAREDEIVDYLIGEAGKYTSRDASRAVIDEANAIAAGAGKVPR